MSRASTEEREYLATLITLHPKIENPIDRATRVDPLISLRYE